MRHNTRVPHYTEATVKTAPRISVLSLLTNTILLGGALLTFLVVFN